MNEENVPRPLPIERIVVNGLEIEGSRFLMGETCHDIDQGTLTLTFCNVRTLVVSYLDGLCREAGD